LIGLVGVRAHLIKEIDMRSKLIILSLILAAIPVAVSLAMTQYMPSKLLQVEYTQLTRDAQRQIDCLAANIYHEAASEPRDGRIAVGLVTLNRVYDERYPKDICSVVKQKTNHTCQFTWYCKMPSVRSQDLYEQAKDIALHVYANYERMADFTNGALFYHADYVNPRWRGLERTVVIGRHIFYKEKN
jgi:spore germination cell wall hydrolase CwlJ-like protein